MQTEYPIIYDNQKVGIAEMTRQGMYYRIRCQLSGHIPQPCRVILRKQDSETDLGLCFREGQGFALAARLPVKAVGEGDLTFEVHAKPAEPDMIFLPVEQDVSFPYPALLKNARFAVVNSKTGVYIPKITVKSQALPDSDQSP